MSKSLLSQSLLDLALRAKNLGDLEAFAKICQLASDAEQLEMALLESPITPDLVTLETFKPVTYAPSNEECVIALTDGISTIIDSQDVIAVSAFSWRAMRAAGVKTYYYASATSRSNGKRVTLLMHRLLIGAKPGEIVDHINRDPLDNRRKNLRLVDANQSAANKVMRNKLGYKGIRRQSGSGRFEASICFRGERRSVFGCRTPLEAAMEYDKMALETHGEYAALNFPKNWGGA